MQTTAYSITDRRLLQRILFDLIIAIVLIVPIIVCEFGIEPFRRGFFCDDETIRYPFHSNTVTPVVLGLLLSLPGLFIFLIVEFIRYYNRGQMNEAVRAFNWNIPTWLVEFLKHNSYFLFGMVLTFDATEVGKYTMGRLRPHFIAVCQPQLEDGSTCSDPKNQYRYIENYICIANAYTSDDVRQARLSFPSGHSSLIFFAMVYLSLYIQRKMTWKGSKFARHFVQFILITVAWFTALSRVMDNWHHWSDVLVGSLIGVVVAIITAKYVTKIFAANQSSKINFNIGLPRSETAATLQDIISTPPPYAVDTSPNCYANEEYCTKV